MIKLYLENYLINKLKRFENKNLDRVINHNLLK